MSGLYHPGIQRNASILESRVVQFSHIGGKENMVHNGQQYHSQQKLFGNLQEKISQTKQKLNRYKRKLKKYMASNAELQRDLKLKFE